MMRRTSTHERGLSLVELLLGLAITALVLVPLVPMLGTASAAARIGADRVAVEQEADFALEYIGARIRAASDPKEFTGSSCAPGKLADYDVINNELVKNPGKDQLVLAKAVTCITFSTISSSSGQKLIQVSLDLTQGAASTTATAVVPLGVAR